VKGNFHARFCSRDGGSDSPVYCNRTGEQRWCMAHESIHQSVVVLPPSLSVGVGRKTRIAQRTAFARWLSRSFPCEVGG
jgi:hypothetical protein